MQGNNTKRVICPQQTKPSKQKHNSMTTEAQAPSNPQSATEEIEVTRNGVSLTFAPTEFSRGEKKKLGIKYPYTGDISAETLDAFRKWLGDENFFGMINEGWRLWDQSIYNSVLKNNADTFKGDTFKEYAQELSVTSETLKDLNDKIGVLTGSLTELTTKAFAAQQAGDANAQLALMSEFMKISDEMKLVNTKIQSKKRVRKVKADEEDDDTAAQPATANA